MICKCCDGLFNETEVKHGKFYDRGDGVMYGSSSYSANYIYPHCGYDNSPKKIY